MAVLLVVDSMPVTRAQEALPWMRVDVLEVLPRELDEFIEVQIMQRALGERTSNVAAGLAGVVLSVERTVLRYDSELSFSGTGPEGGRFR